MKTTYKHISNWKKKRFYLIKIKFLHGFIDGVIQLPSGIWKKRYDIETGLKISITQFRKQEIVLKK
jgi:hypothetical protein